MHRGGEPAPVGLPPADPGGQLRLPSHAPHARDRDLHFLTSSGAPRPVVDDERVRHARFVSSEALELRAVASFWPS